MSANKLEQLKFSCDVNIIKMHYCAKNKLCTCMLIFFLMLSKKGDVLSPNLFKLFVDDLVNKIKSYSSDPTMIN